MWYPKISARLNDVLPGWIAGDGIFASLQDYDVPWKNDDISASLDLIYHGNVSGCKLISPLVNKVKSGNVLTELERSMLAASIVAVYGVSWSKEWETLSLQYNPIENYSMTEVMTNDETVHDYGKSTTRTDNLTHAKTGTETEALDKTDTRTDNLTHAKIGTETRTDNLTETTTPNLTTTTDSAVYGFNSQAAVPTGEQTGVQTGTTATTHTGTEQRQYNLSDTDSGTQATVTDSDSTTTYNTTDRDSGTQTNVTEGDSTTTFNTTDTDTGTQTTLDGGSDTSTRNYELSRAGNIGVTTSQQMIQSERDLWKWNYFYDVVFLDLDRMLTLQIY